MSDDQAAVEAKVEKESDFRVFTSSGEIPNVTFYYIESTAPNNVEQRTGGGGRPPDGLTPIDPDTAVKEIAQTLVPPDKPATDANLVVMVHGFNNPPDEVLKFYGSAVEALKKDSAAIFGPERRTVCIGYRWPSESMFSVARSSISAMPWFPLGLLIIAALVIVLRLFGAHFLAGFFTTTAVVIVATILVLAALRAIVYFRDTYRATNYGVPDLVEVLRQIDAAATNIVDAEAAAGKPPRQRISLSFIGHSMGGLVVTNAIRVLSDVFNPQVLRTYLSGQERQGAATKETGGGDEVTGKIGHVFTLMRFVLASPDIPAETLLADRANFLASSLRRFREAYLFSNEGDEVLRLISTTANYFSFPTQKRNFGYRLGNTEILSTGFGSIAGRPLLEELRVGDETLADLSSKTRRRRHPNLRKHQNPAEVAEAFTYFDCTDYVDEPGRKGYLTQARNYKAHDPNGCIPYLEHINLLWKYISPLVPADQRINVHGGYFEGAVSQRLIYRLACLGFNDATKAYGGQSAMLDECAQHQIRVVLSGRLGGKPREMMERSA